MWVFFFFVSAGFSFSFLTFFPSSYVLETGGVSWCDGNLILQSFEGKMMMMTTTTIRFPTFFSKIYFWMLFVISFFFIRKDIYICLKDACIGL